MVNLNRWSYSIGGHIRKECGGNVREVVTSEGDQSTNSYIKGGQ